MYETLRNILAAAAVLVADTSGSQTFQQCLQVVQTSRLSSLPKSLTTPVQFA